MSVVLRPYQVEAVERVRDCYRRGRRAPLLVLPTGAGKCLARGTPVLMFDGRVRPVEAIRVGDLLMGPDSKPRRVVSLARGREEMFKVTPNKGEPYTVNRSHILSLRMTGGSLKSCGIPDGEIVNVSVADYLTRNKTFKHCAKGWRAAAEFEAHGEPLRLDPYFLGVWLGDGSSRIPAVTTGDLEVADAVREYAASVGLGIREEPNSPGSVVLHLTTGKRPVGRGHRTNPVSLALHQYGLLGDKHIPHRYLTATRADRLELLAGIIDSDGYYSGKSHDLCLKSERLFDDVLFLARSLGFAAYKAPTRKTCGNNGAVGDYWRCSISGDIDAIPCRIPRKQAAPRRQIKNALMTGIKVESVGEGDYYGFELAGPDRLFLLGDFTVTHNTVAFSHIAHGTQSRGKRVLILAHRRELVRQASRKLADAGVSHGIIAPGFTPTNDSVQVASVQTLARRIETLPPFDLIVIDEAHHAVAGQWARIIAAQPRARLLGVTATPERLDGRGLGIRAGGCFDDMVLGPSVADLIAQGHLTPARVYAPAEKPDLSGVRTKGGDFDTKQLEERVNVATITGDVVAHYGRLAPGLPTIAFCITVQHAQDVAASLRAAGYRSVCGHGGMSPGERDAAINGLATGEVQILTTCDLVSEGLDVPSVGAAILLRPTKSLGLYLQQVGRGLRPAPDKQHLIVLDHAGCTTTHDMPDAPRAWSLAGRPKTNAAPDLMQCPECLIMQPPARKCFACGVVFGTDDEDEREGRALFHEDGDLVEMDEARIAKLRAGRLRDHLTGRETRQQLEEIAWARGYKRGWITKVLEEQQTQRGAAA